VPQNNAEQKIQEIKKFLEWLKQDNPVPVAKIEMIYTNSKHLRRIGINATLRPVGPYEASIEVAIGRPTNDVLRSVAHEWMHVIQLYQQHIPFEKIKLHKELEAEGFAVNAIMKYLGISFAQFRHV